MIPVIICGGVGTKMWPASRRQMPKHFLPLVNGKSLFRHNYEALRSKYKPEEIFIQTTDEQAGIAKKQAGEIPESNYFVEPVLRNTGPAIGFMAAKLFRIAPDEPFMVIQSDVLRSPVEKFMAMMEACDSIVRDEGKLVTGGFKPQFATMGVDYLIRKKNKISKNGVFIHQMDKWLGRDSKERVADYVSEGRAFLHANHYSWTPRLMLQAYQKHKPEWSRRLNKIIEALGTRQEGEVLRREYAMMPSGPTEDVTKLELAKGFVVELDFDWTDFGTWEAVNEKLNKRPGQVACKRILEIDGRGNYVSAPDGKFIATIGVKDLVIVDTGDALLVCRKDQSGRVGEIVDHLKDSEDDRLY